MSKYFLNRCESRKKSHAAVTPIRTWRWLPNGDQRWRHSLLKWFFSSIQMVFSPGSTEFHGGTVSPDTCSGIRLNWPPANIPPRETRMNYHRVSVRQNRADKSREVFSSQSACMCLCVFPCIHVSSRQLEAWPWRPHRSPACESMGNPQRRKLPLSLQEHGSLASNTHTHTYIRTLSRCKGVHLPMTQALKHAQLWPPPLIIWPDTEVWFGVITSEPWLLTRGCTMLGQSSVCGCVFKCVLTQKKRERVLLGENIFWVLWWKNDRKIKPSFISSHSENSCLLSRRQRWFLLRFTCRCGVVGQISVPHPSLPTSFWYHTFFSDLAQCRVLWPGFRSE